MLSSSRSLFLITSCKQAVGHILFCCKIILNTKYLQTATSTVDGKEKDVRCVNAGPYEGVDVFMAHFSHLQNEIVHSEIDLNIVPKKSLTCINSLRTLRVKSMDFLKMRLIKTTLPLQTPMPKFRCSNRSLKGEFSDSSALLMVPLEKALIRLTPGIYHSQNQKAEKMSIKGNLFCFGLCVCKSPCDYIDCVPNVLQGSL